MASLWLFWVLNEKKRNFLFQFKLDTSASYNGRSSMYFFWLQLWQNEESIEQSMSLMFESVLLLYMFLISIFSLSSLMCWLLVSSTTLLSTSIVLSSVSLHSLQKKLISNVSLLLLSLFAVYIFESVSLDNMNLHLTLFRTIVVFSTVGIFVFYNNVFATSFKCVWSDLWLDGLLSIVFCCKDGRLVEKML